MWGGGVHLSSTQSTVMDVSHAIWFLRGLGDGPAQ